MKRLSKIQSVIFLTGGVLMVVGVLFFVLNLYQFIACWAFLVGSVLFALMQLMQSYGGSDVTLRRLKKIQNLSDILFVVAGILMADTYYSFFRNLCGSYENYITYLYNKWVVVLFLAAILEVYTTHRIDHELSKKNIKD